MLVEEHQDDLPERALWIEVLNAALCDLHSRDKARRAAVKRWFRFDQIQPGLFPWVAEALGMDPGAVRKALHHSGRPRKCWARENKLFKN